MRIILKSLVCSVLALVAVSCSRGGNQQPIPDGFDMPDLPDVSSDAEDGDGGDTGCPPGETLCDGACVDTSSDHENCGSCGNGCATDEVCMDGTCASGCVDPLVECDGGCVDLTTDPTNCGSCGNVCPEGGTEDINMVPACEDGTCTLACAEGWVDLDPEAPGCEYPCTRTGDVDLCNGVDDNCDGRSDEGFDCVFGETVVCSTTCLSTGTGVCGIGCNTPTGTACVPPVETCNGLDDDCADGPDNGFDCAAGSTVSCTTDCGSTGTGTCTDACEIPAGVDCSAGAEVCNGSDDNCNGEPDEGLPCVMSRPTPCTTTCGSTGTGTCSTSCTLPAPSACTPPAETCNGADDDCDTRADDGFACVRGASVACTTTCGTPGTGICTDACEIPTGTTCSTGTEICDGLDNDCNTLPDDTFPCVRLSSVSCTTTCGSTGTGSCSSSCDLPVPSSCTPPLETCNGRDDDCDTLPDDGYPCVQGTPVTCTTICGTTGSGTCSTSCSRPSAPSCTPPTEICNGLDEDCVAGPDNGFACAMGMPTPCTTTCGSTGTGVCSSTCTLPSPSSCTVPVETCNGADDDCDTLRDDGFACVRGTAVSCTTTCGSTGTGTCSTSCALPAPSSCTPPTETCNGADDDCDTLRDDGFACVSGAGVSCTTTCGSTGTGTCSTSCTLPAPSSCTPPTETCNGADDDCDTLRDDGFACVRGSTGIACTTPSGVAGTADCTTSCTLGPCCAPSETCNGLDDDCDTIPDDGFACVRGSTGLSCTTGGGAPGTRSCTSSCTLTTCCASSETGYCTNSFDDDCDTIPDSSDPDCACTFNDDCTCPFDVTVPGTRTGDTTAAVDNFNPGCGSTGGRDVVWRMVVSSTSTLQIDTNGSVFDTMLGVYSGSCAGTLLACDDDAGTGTASLVTWTFSPGTYWIVVDGFSSTSYGAYTLNVGPVTGGGETCPSGIGYTWPGTATGSTASYFDDYSSWSCQSWSEGPDVVYTMVLSTARSVTVDTNGSGFDTVLALLSSSCSELYCDDDSGTGLQSSIGPVSLSAGTYYIVVDGYNFASGSYTLTVTY